MSDFTLGVAMIARNGGAMIDTALEPFKGIADEVAIVLGGVSTDDTEAVARRQACKISYYDGLLGNNGELLDFAAARNQSFALCETDWVIVVDTDDQWEGTEHIRSMLERIEDPENTHALWVGYVIGEGGLFYQPRVFRRNTGRWDGAVHERFAFNKDAFTGEPNALKTSDVVITQQSRSQETEDFRRQQNIDICRRVIDENPGDYKILAQLINEYLFIGDFEQGLETANQYLEAWTKAEERQYSDELAHVWSRRGYAQLNCEDFGNAALSSLWSLAVLDRSAAWTFFAESTLRMADMITRGADPNEVGNERRGRALYNLAIFAAEQATAGGRPRDGYADDVTLSTYKPMILKALAYTRLNEPRKALYTLDLALTIEPEHEMMLNFRDGLAEQLNEVS